MNGAWGSVCDSDDIVTDIVACRQLGLLQVEGQFIHIAVNNIQYILYTVHTHVYIV